MNEIRTYITKIILETPLCLFTVDRLAIYSNFTIIAVVV